LNDGKKTCKRKLSSSEAVSGGKVSRRKRRRMTWSQQYVDTSKSRPSKTASDVDII
jgi:hypothetical protein